MEEACQARNPKRADAQPPPPALTVAGRQGAPSGLGLCQRNPQGSAPPPPRGARPPPRPSPSPTRANAGGTGCSARAPPRGRRYHGRGGRGGVARITSSAPPAHEDGRTTGRAVDSGPRPADGREGPAASVKFAALGPRPPWRASASAADGLLPGPARRLYSRWAGRAAGTRGDRAAGAVDAGGASGRPGTKAAAAAAAAGAQRGGDAPPSRPAAVGDAGCRRVSGSGCPRAEEGSPRVGALGLPRPPSGNRQGRGRLGGG